MRRGWLVRHAHHDRLGRVLCGRMPGVSLSELGGAQAHGLGAWLGNVRPGRVLSSPQARAQETAAPIADTAGVPIEIAAELDEIDFGEWTGHSFDGLSDEPLWQAWNATRSRVRPPGGESFGDVESRIAALLARLGSEEGRPAILVSHGDVIRAAALHLLGLDLDAYDRIEVAPASFSEIALWPGGGRLVSLNERVGP